MKRTLASLTSAGAVLVLALSLPISGCSKSKGSVPPARQKSGQAGPAWTLTLKSNCEEGTAAEECLAFYGFSVDAEGRYKIGPTPGNQSRAESLKEDHRRLLLDAIKPFLDNAQASALSSESCADREEGSETRTQDTVTLAQLDQQGETVVQSDPAKFCSRFATAEQGKALHDLLRTLAQEYYSLPFPDACLDAALAVEALYAPLQACSTASDCTYVDESFSVVPGDSEQFIYEDACSLVKPIVVGNATLVSGQAEALVAALEKAQESCGQRIWRSDCLNATGFMSNTGAPICDQGICKRNPSAHPYF